jgi:flagella basal body P-ring formation protein FlgA
MQRLSFTALSFLFAGAALAQPLSSAQSLESIQTAAETYIASQLSTTTKHYVTATHLDPRLRLAECATPLEAFSMTPGIVNARSTVGVRCGSDNGWTLYVPVTVEVEVPVLVLRRSLARRARVEPTDVEAEVRRLPGTAQNFITDVASLQGHRLKRSLTAGSALTTDAMTPDVVVRRGQQVTLLASLGSIEIRAQGQALTEGAVSDRVRVQNVSSLRVVEGVVENDNVVRVGI